MKSNQLITSSIVALSITLSLVGCSNSVPIPEATPSSAALLIPLPFPISVATPTPEATPTPLPTATATPVAEATTSPTPTPSPTPAAETKEGFFSVKLVGTEEVPAIATQAQGLAALTLSEDKTSLSIEVSTSGLSGPITGAHIHQGAIGSTGAAIKTLTVNGSIITATWAKTDTSAPLTDAFIDELSKDNLYINVHTATHPEGEIRGQIKTSTDRLYPVYLSGIKEVPAIKNGGSGLALLRLNAAEDTITLEGRAHSLSGDITGAHLHSGANGVTGDPVKTIDVSGAQLSSTWKKTDSDQALTDELVTKLKAGELYLNVHTALYAEGEMRGQVTSKLPTDIKVVHYFNGELNGDNQSPTVSTEAIGYVQVQYDPSTKEANLFMKVGGQNGSISGAHIYKGAVGTTGAIVKTLDTSGNTITGKWTNVDASQPLTDALLTDLFSGNLYINILTANQPEGEIRTQLIYNPDKVYTVGLEGLFAVPTVSTDATGVVFASLSKDHKKVTLTGKAFGLSGDITTASINEGAPGSSGSSVKNLVVSDGNKYSVTWTSTDSSQPLTKELIEKLLQGDLYINLATDANTTGEIRGQLQ